MSTDEIQQSQRNFALQGEKLSAAIDHLVDGIVLTDEKGSVILWNPKLEEITGIKAAEVLGKPFWDVQFQMMPPEQQSPEVLASYRDSIKNLLQTGHSPWIGQDLTREHLHPDGTRLYIQGTVFSVETEEGFMLGSISRNITKRKQTEDALKKSERRLASAQRMARLGSWYWDIQSGVVEWTEETYHIFGLDQEKFQPQIDSVMNRFHPDDQRQHEELIRQAIEKQEEYTFEARILLPDNSTRNLLSTSEGFFDDEGNLTQISGTVQDITKLKVAEQELLESENRFQYVMEATKDGLYDWNLVSNEIYYSPGWKNMLGYEHDELPNDFSVWETLTEPEDVKRSWEMQQELINKERERFEIEFKMKHKEGHWIDILSRATAIFDRNGKAVRIVGTHIDITERKQAEERQRLTDARLSVVFNNTTDLQMLSAVEPDGRFRVVTVNKAYIDAGNNFGMQISKEKLIGKTLTESFSIMGLGQEILNYTKDYYRTAIETRDLVKYTETIPLELGIYHAEITLVPVFDQDGKALYILYNSHNISELRETAVELEKLNTELEDRVKERTERLQILVDTMVDREVRMAGLKKVIKKLRVQLQDAGLEPVADDPLLGDQSYLDDK